MRVWQELGRRPGRAGLAAAALLGATVWACGAALPGPSLCSERDTCDEGRACVLGRCRETGTMPISTDAAMMTFEPVDLAYVAPGGVQARADLDEALVIGRRGEAAQLVMRYAVTIPPERKLQRALLVMDPLPRCPRQPGRIRLEVAHVLAPWSSGELSPARLPKLSLPMHAGDLTVTPARALRVDVTDVVREWAEHRSRYHGLALQGVGDSATGACFTSGVAWGRGPRLEIYLWPDDDGSGGGGGAGGGEGGGGGANGGGDGVGGDGTGGAGGGR